MGKLPQIIFLCLISLTLIHCDGLPKRTPNNKGNNAAGGSNEPAPNGPTAGEPENAGPPAEPNENDSPNEPEDTDPAAEEPENNGSSSETEQPAVAAEDPSEPTNSIDTNEDLVTPNTPPLVDSDVVTNTEPDNESTTEDRIVVLTPPNEEDVSAEVPVETPVENPTEIQPEEAQQQPPVALPHRYWRLMANGKSYSNEVGSFQITEVEFFPSTGFTGPDISNPDTAISSSEYSFRYVKENAFDDLENTYWADRNITDPNQTRWIGQDFGMPTTIGSLKIKGAEWNGQRQFTPKVYLEYSDDNIEWKISDELSLADNTDWQSFDFVGFPKQDCTLEFGVGTQSWNGINWQSCVATSCNEGYHVDGGTCQPTPPGAHRYWRLMTNTSTFSPSFPGAFQIVEVEMYASSDLSGEDLTSKGKPLASSIYSSAYQESRAFDNKTTTYGADGNLRTSSKVRWIGQYFDVPVEIKSLNILGLKWGSYGLFSPIIVLEYSDDGLTWTPKAELPMTDTSQWQSHLEL